MTNEAEPTTYLPDPANDETLTMTGYEWWRYRRAIEAEARAESAAEAEWWEQEARLQYWRAYRNIRQAPAPSEPCLGCPDCDEHPERVLCLDCGKTPEDSGVPAICAGWHTRNRASWREASRRLIAAGDDEPCAPAPSEPGLDVETLALALAGADHGTEYRDRVGRLVPWRYLGEQERERLRGDARRILAEYARLRGEQRGEDRR